jgi:hypothetical protein
LPFGHISILRETTVLLCQSRLVEKRQPLGSPTSNPSGVAVAGPDDRTVKEAGVSIDGIANRHSELGNNPLICNGPNFVIFSE